MRRYRQPLGSTHCAATALARSITAKNEWEHHKRHMPLKRELYSKELLADAENVLAELRRGTHKSQAKLTPACKTAASPAECPCTKVCVRCTCAPCRKSPSGGLFSKKMLNLVVHHGRFEVTGPHSTVPCSLSPTCAVCAAKETKPIGRAAAPGAPPAVLLQPQNQVPAVSAKPPAAAPATCAAGAGAGWCDTLLQSRGGRGSSGATTSTSDSSRDASPFEPVPWECTPRAEEPVLLGVAIGASENTLTASLGIHGEDAVGAWATGAAAMGDATVTVAPLARVSSADMGFVADTLPRSASGAIFYDPINADLSMCHTMSLMEDLSAQFDAEEIAPTLVERLRDNITEMRVLLMAGLEARPDVGMSDFSERVGVGVGVSGASFGGSESDAGMASSDAAYVHAPSARGGRKRPAGVRSATAGLVVVKHESEASLAANRVRELGVSTVVCVRLEGAAILDTMQGTATAGNPRGAICELRASAVVGGVG